MLDLKLNGVSFEITDDINIQVEITSSLFDDDEEGTLSLPFNIPITDHNSILLGSPEEIKNRTGMKRVYDNFAIYFHGQLWKKGVLRLRSISGGNYVTNFNSDYSYFANKSKNKKLKDLNLGGDRVIRDTTPFLKLKLIITGPAGYDGGRRSGYTANLISLYITNRGSSPLFIYYFPFTTSVEQTLINLADQLTTSANNSSFWDDWNLTRIVADGDTITFYSADDGFPVFVDFSSNPGLGREWQVINAFGSDQVLAIMQASANATIDTLDYVFFPVKNEGLYEDDLTYVGYVNYYTGGQFAPNGSEDFPGNHPISPYPYMLYVFKKCFTDYGLTPKGAFLIDDEIKKLVIYNNFILDRLVYNEIYGRFDNQWMNYFNLQKHVPDLAVSEFIKAIKAGFFLCYFFNYEKGEVVIKTKNEILDDPDFEDWTSKVQPKPIQEVSETDGFVLSPLSGSDGTDKVQSLENFTIKPSVASVADLPAAGNDEKELRLVRDLNVYYKPHQSYSGTTITWVWEAFSENIGDYTIGNGKDKIDLQFSATPTARITDASDYDKNWLVPEVNQKGSSYDAGQGIDPAKLMLCFYRGFHNDGGGSPYPLGTPYKMDYAFNTIGTRSLATDQIYEDAGRKWLRFLENTQSLQLPMIMDYDDILNLDFSKKKMIDGVKFIHSKIKLVLTKNSVRDIVGDFLKV